jgi:3-deoxy-manno-octulosonate cytidylyltransferase (CMP-KDO synthetase)
MRSVIVIPARYASSRLPGKPLLRATGKYLIEHVYERAMQARSVEKVLVATDDRRIEAAVRSFGGNVVLTRNDHVSGTDRVAEVASQESADLVINLQGDEPLIEPDALDFVADLLVRHQQAAMATLATPLRTLEQYQNPNCVKVVVGDLGQALYFSRSPIPHVRDQMPDFIQEPFQFFHHVGLYAYRREFLLRLAQSPASSLEQLEKLEQLRVLALGQRIQVGVVAQAASGVDTSEDYDRFVRQWRTMQPAPMARRAA